MFSLILTLVATFSTASLACEKSMPATTLEYGIENKRLTPNHRQSCLPGEECICIDGVDMTSFDALELQGEAGSRRIVFDDGKLVTWKLQQESLKASVEAKELSRKQARQRLRDFSASQIDGATTIAQLRVVLKQILGDLAEVGRE